MHDKREAKFILRGAALPLLAVLAAISCSTFLGKPRATRAELEAVTREHPYTNSLGMPFVPVPATKVLFCLWKTRVKDYDHFVWDTGYEASGGMFSLCEDGWKQRGDDWNEPGFKQTPDNPVCGVSYEDAKVFCRWLSRREKLSYRLPTDAEWTQGMGNTQYPWGNQFPPPPGVGNYAGEEARNGHWPSGLGVIAGYRDGFPRTSPVEQFPPNHLGLYDMGGNLLEWCEDYYVKEMSGGAARERWRWLNVDGGGRKYRVVRGGSWDFGSLDLLKSSCRGSFAPDIRFDFIGFRIVLELK